MKEMTPKERVMAFFRHEPTDELPTDDGIFVLIEQIGRASCRERV